MSRAITTEEATTEFLTRVKQLAKYWASQGKSVEDACDGVAFSILSLMDGSQLNFPAVDLVLCPDETDKEYSKEEGENWYEESRISTTLHEEYCNL
jgi:hypothetical protein